VVGFVFFREPILTFLAPPPRPFLKWLGGKRQLLPELLQAIDAAGAFTHYHEPFLGGGALFFALARSDRLNQPTYISDVNPNLVDAYLGVRDDVDGVIAHLKEHARQHCEDYFYAVRAQSPRTLTQRAARIIYLNQTCFNGLYRENSKGKFNTPFGRYKNPAICREPNLRAVAQTLQGVDIGARGFECVIDLAKANDLIYFDPPYNPISKSADFTSYARGGFGPDEQQRLADTAMTLAGRGVKVILSNSMTEYTRELYQDFHLYEVFASRRINARADRRGKIAEALITSFPMRAESSARSERAIVSTRAEGGLARMRVRQWLLANRYEDVAALIDEVTDEWKAQNKRTRRNWWEVLAGGINGKPRTVAGRAFPVLRAAQLRQGVSVTGNALRRGRAEEAPPVQLTQRWKKGTNTKR
jgi:DNA adenine methylase